MCGMVTVRLVSSRSLPEPVGHADVGERHRLDRIPGGRRRRAGGRARRGQQDQAEDRAAHTSILHAPSVSRAWLPGCGRNGKIPRQPGWQSAQRRSQREERSGALGPRRIQLMKSAFTIGVDYGTNSVRAVVVDCADGRVLGTSVFDYPSGHQGVVLDPRDPHLARQNPGDYLLAASTRRSPARWRRPRASRASRARASSASAWTRPARRRSRWTRTASRSALYPRLHGQLAAYAWLWKDHTAAEEAAAITETARRHAPEYLAPIGGTYSSEWFWSKIWRCLKVAPEIFDAGRELGRAGRLHPGRARRHQGPDGRGALRLRGRPQGDVLRRLGRAAVEGLPRPARPEAGRSCATGSTTMRGRPTGRRAAW